MPFADRAQAGRRLGEALGSFEGRDVVVLGLPRGGVPVAFEVARALGAPLDVILVRKLGVPSQPELGMGAIGEDGVRVLNEEILRVAHIDEEDLRAVEEQERIELERRARRFRGDRPRLPVDGRVAVIVDDGIATGSTARAACRVARAQGASRVILAVPVAPAHSVDSLASDADAVVCLETPETFFAIGQFYRDFSQTSDEEVVACLARATPGERPAGPRSDGRAGPPVRGARSGELDEEVELEADGVVLGGHLDLPDGAPGVVVFAHGSGSSRLSPRNRHVASVLSAAGLGTLLFDLLTQDEERDRRNVFDIGLLARRLAAATDWVRRRPETGDAAIGYFGASTGAAAALWAAAEVDDVRAVVSRGGRPDLAGPRLGDVRAPTLLIVGGSDHAVVEMNRQAQQLLRCESRLEIVPGATHLFEEPGTLTAAANLARDWFTGHLR